MIFADWPTLLDELKVEVLNHVINSQDSSTNLSVISNFALTSRSSYTLIKSLPIWQQFLRQFFPALPQSHINHHDEFKKHYLQCEKMLIDFGANLSSYRLALENQWELIPSEQKNRIISLLLTYGHSEKIASTQMTIAIKRNAFLMAVMLGVNSTIVKYLQNEQSVIAPVYKQAVLKAVKMGQTSTVLLLLDLKSPIRNAIIREALIAAAEHGNEELLQRLLIQPYIKISLYYRIKALQTSIENKQEKCVKRLLEHDDNITATFGKNRLFKQAAIFGWKSVMLTLANSLTFEPSKLTLGHALNSALENNDRETVKFLFGRFGSLLSNTAKKLAVQKLGVDSLKNEEDKAMIEIALDIGQLHIQNENEMDCDISETVSYTPGFNGLRNSRCENNIVNTLSKINTPTLKL